MGWQRRRQHSWTKDREYVVEGVAFHSWHTKLQLRYVEGRFNSVCFGLVGSEL